jgi:hypothetical protein
LALGRRWPTWTDAAVVLVCSGLVAARQGHQLGWFWSYPPVHRSAWLPVSLTVTAALFGTFQPTTAHRENRKQPVRAVWDRHLLQTLGDVLGRCQLLTRQGTGSGGSGRNPAEFRWPDLALHVWRVTWVLQRRPPFLVHELLRIRTVRLGSLPALRPVRFYRGKGVVGSSWLRNDEVIEDNDARYRRVSSEDEWNKLSHQQRDGLSYREFLLVRDRGAILSSPIRDSKGRFIGCVSVDIHRDARLLHDEVIRSEIQQLCIGLGGTYFEGLW